MEIPEGYYLGDDNLLRRKCDGMCDTCPEHCWMGRPVEYFDDEEPDEDADHVEDVIVDRVRLLSSGSQEISWDDGVRGIFLPPIEHTITVGDRITFYWPHPGTGWGQTPLGFRINGGPYIKVNRGGRGQA